MKSEDYLAIFSLSSVLKMAVPHLITRIMFVPTQIGRAMMPMAKGSGDGSEVNPESWTQLKGSNET